MSAQQLLGQPVADVMLDRVRSRITELGVSPQLVAILANDLDASRTYLRMKQEAAEMVGMLFRIEECVGMSSEEIVGRIVQLNSDTSVHGIMVQLPLATELDTHKILEAIEPVKDVDGLTAVNIAAAYLNTPAPRAATAAAVLAILDHHHIELAGKHVVIVGRSRLVGLPLAGMCLARNATVTIVHRHTSNLAEQARQAEVLVVASGVPATVTQDMVHPGAVVVDVGWSKVDNVVVGDVDPGVVNVAGALTPVPGGVGPVTVAQLITNTLEALERQR
ncbi:MAG: bifunctional 5,10-methylenetetrahydrofolate dehydrogenase/5,10-methenyltetrahydrofolate cyclohydrolase [Candidatus Uhrbacteria bacterium]